MKTVLFVISTLVLFMFGCSAAPTASTSTTTATTKSTSASPAAATTSPTANASPATDSKSSGTKKAPTTNPVPADWVRMYDDAKGYEFKVPQGTEHKLETVDGVDVFQATVPKPYEIAVLVVSFKDQAVSKEDLLKRAENILKNLGEKDIKIGDPQDLSDDYSLATMSSVDDKGTITKGKILVGTDITDNYIVLVGTDADKFSANEKTIDEIWGSFGMYSGGSSGKS
jgi:hypothetical protein